MPDTRSETRATRTFAWRDLIKFCLTPGGASLCDTARKHQAAVQVKFTPSIQRLQPGLFMNRRDDWAEHCPHTGFSDRAEYQRVFPREENAVCGQGSSKGVSAFMNSPG